ncbi:peroxin 14, putative [Leishmania tarentolae]|uniref:Peroxisomal membrane protein PEX14 n=1 Tax=Leishmania tarentolae TaxID=5689 RepID=A0A640KFY7_LEITA|nr:peroxin 14, putative [Leishmania tarentolae]
MSAEISAQPQAALEAPLPVPEQPSSSEMDADAAVQSAIRFLQDPRVRRSPVESQIRFLKSKGISDAQIKYALAKVGKTATVEKIASVRAPTTNTALPPPTATTCATPLSAQFNTTLQTAPVTMTPGPRYTQTLFPYSAPPPQVEPQTKRVDWRDIVIGAGAAMLAGFSAYTLFHRYSPYEFRRKLDKKLRSYRGSSSRRRPTNNPSSESETDASSTLQRGRVPPLPPPPPMAGAAEPTVSAASPAALIEEVKKLQTELDEVKESLANERKKCADLAVSAAKIRADKQQLSRANDRLTQQIDGLKKDIEKLSGEKSSAGGEATQTDADRAVAAVPAPPSTYFPSVTVEGEQARKSPGVTPVTNASAPNSDVVPVLAVVASPEERTITTATPTIPDTITETAHAAPGPVTDVTPAPESPLTGVAVLTHNADVAAPVATDTEVAAPLLPIHSVEPPKAGDGVPVSID